MTARRIGLWFLLLFLALGCRTAQPDRLVQVSTIDALLAGAYDGQLTCGELVRHGDLGIGTFEGLDGEMIVLDGQVYQVRADGKVYRPPADLKTPFAAVVAFRPEMSARPAPGTDYNGFTAGIDNLVGNPNLFWAVRAEGRFKHMRTRSVPRQSRPYPPLTEVTRHQPEFEMEDVRGVLVGFRSPAFVKGIGVPGYHLHFITDDRTRGGHVLAFEWDQGEVRVDVCSQFLLVLPEGATAFSRVDLGRDRSGEVERVEK